MKTKTVMTSDVKKMVALQKHDPCLRDARKIAKHAWKILPKKRGHLVIVFSRQGAPYNLAVDAGIDPEMTPMILFAALAASATPEWILEHVAYKLRKERFAAKK